VRCVEFKGTADNEQGIGCSAGELPRRRSKRFHPSNVTPNARSNSQTPAIQAMRSDGTSSTPTW
jgi:hypothetical protein